MAQIDRKKAAFKRLMNRLDTDTATFKRDGAADKLLPVATMVFNDIGDDGRQVNKLQAMFYKIEGDADLVGQATLTKGDAIEIGSETFRYQGELTEETAVSIKANFISSHPATIGKN